MPRTPLRLLSAAALGGLLAVAAAGRPGVASTADLRRMTADELAALYAAAEPGTPPVGPFRGRVVRSVERFPRLRAGAMNAMWKGKDVEPDGSYVNRWAGGVRAIGSSYAAGASWIDGRPAWVFEYPPDTPLLGNTRDELREVAPGLYLGPLYELRPCPRLRGYLAVERECGRR